MDEQKKDMGMDAIDEKQQREIDRLAYENHNQDFWLKVLAIGVVGWVLISTSIFMAWIGSSAIRENIYHDGK